MGALIHNLTRHVKQLMNVVPCMHGLIEAMVHNFQLPILVCRKNYTIMKKVILTLQLHEIARAGALHKRPDTNTAG
jgi:hypothetical protein